MKMWEIEFVSDSLDRIKKLCAAGWEPFAVDNGVIYLKRELPIVPEAATPAKEMD